MNKTNPQWPLGLLLEISCVYSDSVYHMERTWLIVLGFFFFFLLLIFQAWSSSAWVLHLLDVWPLAPSLTPSQNLSLLSDDRFAFSGRSLEHALSVWHSSRLCSSTMRLAGMSGFPAGSGLTFSLWVGVLPLLLLWASWYFSFLMLFILLLRNLL
jgi:hypothetical protein